MSNIHDVAAKIISEFPRGISSMKLHKLAFIAQGWSLVILTRPLFDEDFTIRKNGPYSIDLWNQHGDDAYTLTNWPGDPANLREDEKIIIKGVTNQYGALSGPQLNQQVSKHLNGYPFDENYVIYKDEISKYYKKVLFIS